MISTDLKKYTIPNTPGVYFFLGRNRKILYIGKATTLSTRVRSYFTKQLREKRSLLIEKMVFEAVTVEWLETDSVLEAMLLETNLIRTQKPHYNTRSKDDKSFNHVVITKDEYPRVLVVRGKDLSAFGDDAYQIIYGPFPSGGLFKDALKILRKLFQFYDHDANLRSSAQARQSKLSKGKIDFNRQIGLYPESCTKKEYAKTIRHIRLFFEGKKLKIIEELEADMKHYAKLEKFEEAEKVKRKIFSLNHIQDIALIKDESRVYKDDRLMRIEAYDIAHLAGKSMVGVMTVCDAEGIPQKGEYRKFTIHQFDSANDTGALKEVLERRFKHTEWPTPDLVVIDGGVAQKNITLQVLKKQKIIVPVVSVVKDENHKPKKILGVKRYIEQNKRAILFANSEAHRFAINFHRLKRKKSFLK